MTPELVIDTAERLAGGFAIRFAREVRGAVEARGRCAIALPGGSVAETFFPALAPLALDWARVDFFWGDERAVPPEHPDSNFGMAARLWLVPARVPEECMHRMPADAGDLEDSSARAEADLIAATGRPPRLDLVLLGMGPDGHVCSLFPGHPLLNEKDRWVAAVTDSPKPPPRRLTLTLATLGAADLIAVAAMGQGKAGTVREALRDPRSPLPVALALRGARRSLVMLDPAAASLL